MDESAAETDEELMGAFASGDATAFEALFERYRRRLFTYLLHATSSREAADDLFQEVFLRLVRERERYARAGSFRTWLFTIARNATVDHHRRADVRRVVRSEGAASDGDGAWSEEPASRDPRGDPLLMTDARELRERLRDALARLPAAQREVFLLRERAGLDFAAIARACGCGKATAKSRMRYALENLRRILAGEAVEVPS